MLAAFHGAAPFVVVIGMFTFTLGLISLLGGFFLHRGDPLNGIQIIWLVSALMHFGAGAILAVQIAIAALPVACVLLAAACGLHFLIQTTLLFWRRTPPHWAMRPHDVLDHDISDYRYEWRRWIH
jgi:hypothetical protein